MTPQILRQLRLVSYAEHTLLFLQVFACGSEVSKFKLYELKACHESVILIEIDAGAASLDDISRAY